MIQEVEMLASAPSRKTAVDLSDVVRRVLELLTLRSGRLELKSESAPVFADRGKIYQLVYNLIVAADRTSTSGRPLSLTVHRRQQAATIQLAACCEENRTIRADLLRAIRGEDDSANVPLAIAAQLVQEMGGSWQFRRRDPGFVAVVRLPLSELPIAEASVM